MSTEPAKEVHQLMVTPERADNLAAFQGALERLCLAHKIRLAVQDDRIQVIEKDFQYPDGYVYSASMDDERFIEIEAYAMVDVPAKPQASTPNDVAQSMAPDPENEDTGLSEILLLGRMRADWQSMGEFLKKLDGDVENYASNLRLIRGAAVRIAQRAARLMESA